ncbi:MAG TPA: hypothetical protein VFV34_02665 [Blastocatellia bacterium]|nr:hypothetical protein [Blastocatellia bacterium]
MGVVIDEVRGSVEPEPSSESGDQYGRDGQSKEKTPDIRREMRRIEKREMRLRAD